MLSLRSPVAVMTSPAYRVAAFANQTGLRHRSTTSCSRPDERHHAYIRENLEDLPEVRDWTWTS